MNSRLTRQANQVLRILQDGDADTQAFAQATGLTCPPGCGACCENPSISATPVELLPMAVELEQTGQAQALLERARASSGKWCVFYEAGAAPGLGRCTHYRWRPMVCRLFGYAGVRTRRGLEVAVCWNLHQANPERMTHAQEQVEQGTLAVPVFADHARRVAGLDPTLGRTPLPLNQALVLALEHVLTHAAYARGDGDVGP